MAYTGYERYNYDNRYDRIQADQRRRKIDQNIREDQLEYRKQRRLNKAKGSLSDARDALRILVSFQK